MGVLWRKVAGDYFPRRSTVASLCTAAWMRLYGVHSNAQAMEAWTLNALLQGDADETAFARWDAPLIAKQVSDSTG